MNSQLREIISTLICFHLLLLMKQFPTTEWVSGTGWSTDYKGNGTSLFPYRFQIESNEQNDELK